MPPWNSSRYQSCGKFFFGSKQNLNLTHARWIKMKLTKECCLHKREEITWSGNTWTLISLDQHLSLTHRLDEIMAILNNNKDVIYLYFTFLIVFVSNALQPFKKKLFFVTLRFCLERNFGAELNFTEANFFLKIIWEPPKRYTVPKPLQKED